VVQTQDQNSARTEMRLFYTRGLFMRTRASLSAALLLLTVSSSSALLAQFQPPTPDELKMTVDPKAPGADAVYLNVTQIADGDVNFESFYARIKVLTDNGKELGTVELPYEKHMYTVADIKARTVQPDGTIVPLEGKPADILKAKTKGFQVNRKVFTLPAVQVGSILEYYYQLRYNPNFAVAPDWQIQRSYFVHKAQFKCISCRYVQGFSVLPPGVAIGKDHAGHMVLDMTDIPPAPEEEWMPPMGEMLYKVVFYRPEPTYGKEFWTFEGDSWSAGVNAFVDPSNSFRAVVKGLIQPGDSDLIKAKKLYNAVQELENTDYTREKSDAERKQMKLKEINRAEDVWTQKRGTRTEIALLYLSMLRAAGVVADAMRVVDRDQGVFIQEFYDFDQLDDTIILLTIDGKVIVLDPGEKMCPFRTVSWRHSIATGLSQTATGNAIATTPGQPYSANTIQRSGEISLDAQGGIEGNLRILMTGQEALYWRQFALENDDAEVKKSFDEWIAKMVPDGVEAHIDHFTALDDPESNLAAAITVKGNAGTATSKRLLLPALFFASHGDHPFVDSDKRVTPIDMHFGEQISDSVTYLLPPGFEVESAPKPVKVPWSGHALLNIDSKSDPGKITIDRELTRGFTLLKPDDYPALHDFYQKVATADQQQLTLTRIQAAKGN
jgi:hypothetical protein